MNSIAFFEIQASDLQRSIDFYKNIFAWEFIREEGLGIEYYRIETPGMNGGVFLRPATEPPEGYGTNAFTCSMMVDDFDRVCALILLNGGRVALPKFAVKGRCWQGYFLDPDGNTFGIFQVDVGAF